LWIPPHLASTVAVLGAMAPAAAALLVSARISGREGVRVLVRPVLRAQVSACWYVFALGFFAAIKLAAALIHRLLLGTWPRFGGLELLLVIPFAIAISTPVQAGEEIGWRGFALPRLARRIGLRLASVVLGVIWALWHLPLFYARGADTYHQSFPLYAASVTAISVAMAWLLAKTRGSLLLVMLMHAAVNNTKDIVPSAGTPGPTPFGLNAAPAAWIALALLWVAAGWFLVRMPGVDALRPEATAV
jgi:membrane protease YdiL (CAAX protease family)